MPISINGSGTVTGISVGGLPDGIVDTDMLAASAVTVAKASGSVKGITQVDVWRFTSNLSCPTSSTVISANWEQVDTDSQANPIGSSMTQSSGTFTFPSTGKYLILVHQNHESTSGEGHYVYVDTYVTSDNSSYDRAARGFSNCSSGGAINTLSSSFFFDVTDVSTHKVRFYAYAYNSNQLLRGTTAYNENSYTFIKLGET